LEATATTNIEPQGRHRRFIASARTNLPVWPAVPPPIDEAGRGFILLGLGADAGDVLAGWRSAIDALNRPCRQRLDPEAPANDALIGWLGDALASAVVGWRLMLAGPSSEILLLSARARAAGMLESEIRSFATADAHVRVQCVHCKTPFRCEGEPGAIVACPGCGRHLLIHQHLSRRHAALVAFIADVEKPR
jgi:ribosomal protein S27E